MSRVLFGILILVLASSAFAQSATNNGAPLGTPGPYQLWPMFPPVGIGTETSGGPWESALQIHDKDSLPAVLRFSQGGSTSTDASGLIALIPNLSTLVYPSWLHLSSLITGQDFVMRANHGDLILASNWKDSGAVRFATRPPNAALAGAPAIDTDYERLTILGNGNVGINVPAAIGAAVAKPLDQLSIGGSNDLPGFSIYGGDRFEGKPRAVGGGNFPIDWRSITLNGYTNHWDTSSNRYHREKAMSTAQIAFDENTGGMIKLGCYPYDSARGIDNFTHELSLSVSGNTGLQVWSYESSGDPFHHLFDVWRPNVLAGSVTRNPNGLFFHHTPVYIGGSEWPDFINFANQKPTLGDGKTWMLAVSGPMIAKEIYVNDTVWADFVFDPSYRLMPLSEVESFVAQNKHLPDIPSAKEIAASGLNIGKTETKLTQKVEELTLYIIEQQREIEELKSEVRTLKQGGK